jgi:nicotinate-nucleotide adenylyltransferase
MVKKVVLFGMSANPIHQGHLHVARQVYDYSSVDEVQALITPGHNLRVAEDYVPLSHRLAMARLAAAAYSWLHVSDFEAQVSVKDEDARTWEVIQAWRSTYPQDQPIWLMGADSWGTFHLWKGHDHMLANLPLIVVSRGGYTTPPDETVAGRRFASQRLTTLDTYRPGWLWLDIPPHTASATAIRAGDDRYLSKEVQAYIKQHHLFGACAKPAN